MCNKEPLYALGTGAFFYSVLSSDEIVFSSAGADCLERFGPSALHFPRGRQITNNEEEEMKKKMSRTLAVLMCLMTAVAFMPTFAFAEEGAASEQESVQQQEQSVDAQAEEEEAAAEQEPAPLAEGEEVSTEESINVVVAINVKGTFEIENKTVEVTDYNKNGSFDIDDTLYCAHEQYYDGGAEAGYSSYTGNYGLSLGKLWGDNSGNFGYYVNNAYVLSLAAPVKNGEYVYAFVYTDDVNYGDTYSYFDKTKATVEVGQELDFELLWKVYDENWNLMDLPYEGAEIKVNGNTKGITDSKGKASIKIYKQGTYAVTASAPEGSKDILASPLCIVTVTEMSDKDKYNDEFELTKTKEEAVAELTNTYKIEAYRDYVKVSQSVKLISGIVAINAATSIDEVCSALKTAKTELNKIKTDAQMTADENAVRAIGISSFSVKAGKKKATVNWKRNTTFSGYQIYYKQSGKKAKYTYASSTASSKTIKSLKKGKKYTFKVRGYKKMNGKTIYSNKWSSSKTVRIK